MGEIQNVKEEEKPRKQSVWRKIGIGLVVLIAIWFIIYLMPFTPKQKHPMFENDRPLVMAHQGGQHLAPSSTMEAFLNAYEMGVDIIEFDIHMSKDGYLI